MEGNKLNKIVEEIQRQYNIAKSDYMKVNILISKGPAKKMRACCKLIEEINKTHHTHYQVNLRV